MRIVARLHEVYARSGLGALLPMRAKLALRRVWARASFRMGHPVGSPLFAKPPLRPGRRPMRLTHVVLASDANPRYLECWPLTRRAWREVLGVEALLVLVAGRADAPPELLADEAVHVVEPLEGIATGLQAQCIRLLYPAVLDVDGGVMVSDMELMPLSPSYFHGPLAHLDERMFVSYRDLLFYRRMMAIAYNVARPETWRSIFGVETVEDVRARLDEWTRPVFYHGMRGAEGWYTDQEALFATLESWPERSERLWVMDDAYTGFLRLDRHDVSEGGLTREQARAIRRRRYTDYDSHVPHSEFRELNETVLRLASDGTRTR